MLNLKLSQNNVVTVDNLLKKRQYSMNPLEKDKITSFYTT